MPVLSESVSALFFWSGGHLLSHIVSNAVPSAVWVLTVVFGMGTGVSPKRIATRNLLLYNCRACRSFLTSNPFHVFSVESIPLIHLPVLMCILRTSFSLCLFALPSVHSLLDSQTVKHTSLYFFFLRKEVIQPHLPIRLPCYDFTLITNPTFDCCLLS